MVEQKLKVIDENDLKNFKNESKCCIIINDLVYDVSSFYEHPGGFDLFKEYEGIDATASFNEIGHSTYAKKLMKSYLIGVKKDTEKYKKKVETKIIENEREYINVSEEEIEEEEDVKTYKPPNVPEEKSNYSILALVIVLFSIAYYFMFIRK
ncbi:cytochrome b5, putative [Plasmodium gallinaceum]|uniref:Cytochrome b5, putative n=1 Tax=Plasmodium gallinaceum TaxID=5849 RepID=A0A1J1GXJ6_PLAGA|nr:cytochrome b5, putative [Plasmodium gallinaceum]CRG96960.1 cytochrome b5, putative [Plasmodium gallinaceum]